MKLTINNEGGKMIVTFSGRLDTAAAQELSADMEKLADDADKHIILDCRELEFISSLGLRLLLGLRKASIAKGGSVTVAHCTSDVKQIFVITGFSSLFNFV